MNRSPEIAAGGARRPPVATMALLIGGNAVGAGILGLA